MRKGIEDAGSRFELHENADAGMQRFMAGFEQHEQARQAEAERLRLRELERQRTLARQQEEARQRAIRQQQSLKRGRKGPSFGLSY